MYSQQSRAPLFHLGNLYCQEHPEEEEEEEESQIVLQNNEANVSISHLELLKGNEMV